MLHLMPLPFPTPLFAFNTFSPSLQPYHSLHSSSSLYIFNLSLPFLPLDPTSHPLLSSKAEYVVLEAY